MSITVRSFAKIKLVLYIGALRGGWGGRRRSNPTLQRTKGGAHDGVIYGSEIKRLGRPAGEIIKTMKNRDASRHPGVMRVMHVDSEFAGLLVAVGFLVMGVIGLDIGKWFVMGALVLGVGVALLLRFIHKGD